MTRSEKKHREKGSKSYPNFKEGYHQWPFFALEGLAAGLLVVGYMLSISPTHKIAAVWIFFGAFFFGALGISIRLTHEFSKAEHAPTSKEDVSKSIIAHIETIDGLREEGRTLQHVFGAPTGNPPDGEPDRRLGKVQLCLRSISQTYVEHFDEILKDPRRYTGGGFSPPFTQAEMNQWQSDPRRPKAWPSITAVLNYLDQIRDELYKNIK